MEERNWKGKACGEEREQLVKLKQDRRQTKADKIVLFFFNLTTQTETEIGLEPRQDMTTEYDEGKSDKQEVKA